VQNRFPAEPHPEALPQPVAERLLERASEMDAIRAAGSAVADLRAAAGEAGISTHAFDAALAELQEAEQPRVLDVRTQRRRGLQLWAVAASALIAIGALAVSRTPSSDAAVPGVPVVEEAISLRCLSPGEAAELIRPLLQLRSNTVVYAPARAPRVLTVRATAEQLQRVKEVLEKYESAGSATCGTPPTGMATP